MADHGIFIGWSGVVAGRERQAEKVFGEAINGFMLIRGELDALHALLASPEWERLSARTMAIVHDLGVINASLGAETMRLLQATEGYTSDLA